jgi:hypothetical protein
VQRYVREHPGDLIHIDVKKLARFRKVDHRITGNRQQVRSAGVGYDRVHVAIDDATRRAYFEVLADGRAASHGHRICAVLWLGSTARAWNAGRSCRITVRPTSHAALPRLARPWASCTSALGPTRPGPMARPSDMASGRLRLHSDPLPGIGLRDALPELRGTQLLAAALPLDL